MKLKTIKRMTVTFLVNHVFCRNQVLPLQEADASFHRI